MAWTDSKIFTYFVNDLVTRGTIGFDLDLPSSTQPYKVALYGNITPSNTVDATAAKWGSGVWSSGNEVYSTGGWNAGGLTIAGTGVTWSAGSSSIKWGTATSTQSSTTVTLTGFYGCLVHKYTSTPTPEGYGVCYNYFGGVNNVQGGTFTVIWSANGIMSFNT